MAPTEKFYVVGRVKHDDGTFSDKITISHSGYDLWKKNKVGYRKRYYDNEESFETAETIFGKTVHEALEKVSIGGETELRGRVTDGENSVKLVGHLDSFDKDTLAIKDHKSGHLDKNGKVPWDRVKVQRHKQLVFYSLLVLLNFGDYNNTATLDWHETKFKKSSQEFDGHILEGETRDLELTGFVQSFTRKVYKYEIENLAEELLRTAKEINEDYILWQTKKQ